MATNNLYFHEHRVARELKEKRNQHKSKVLFGKLILDLIDQKTTNS